MSKNVINDSEFIEVFDKFKIFIVPLRQGAILEKKAGPNSLFDKFNYVIPDFVSTNISSEDF
jgi:hypothetical protein